VCEDVEGQIRQIAVKQYEVTGKHLTTVSGQNSGKSRNRKWLVDISCIPWWLSHTLENLHPFMFKFNTSVLKTDLWSTAERAPSSMCILSYTLSHSIKLFTRTAVILEESRTYWLCGLLKICRPQQLSAAEIHCAPSTVRHSSFSSATYHKKIIESSRSSASTNPFNCICGSLREVID